MRAFSPAATIFRRAIIPSLAVGIGCALPGCATAKKEPTAAPTAASAATKPTPAPTPEVRYRASARIEAAPGSPAPSPSQANAETTATPPAPTPPAAVAGATRPNIFVQAWQKIFPAKAAATPPAESAGARPAAPREGIFARLWHLVFPRREEPPAARPPVWIGTIRLVNAADGYVLVDASTALALGTGAVLHSVGNDTESGIVKVSADRNPPFFLADIVSGKPAVGDRVYSPEP